MGVIPSLSFIFETIQATNFDFLNSNNALQSFRPSPNIF